ncbi:hypothetical protein OEA41_003009 [Lepraria neglecta]|uniref:Uncharacterized protein n=1 Tax=Lepraria neglecta TaxID=209136 RepID=A0AAD9Z400_9LECA|nr:hypothetical protein OEA41_003009 [Lepraria neglecta]
MPNSENASMDEAFDDDEFNTNQSRTSSPPSLQSFESPLKAVSVDGKSLDGLGYLNNNADNFLGYLKIMNTLREEDSDLATTDNNSVVIGSEVKALLKKVPERAVTDILIQHFLSEANWIYEMVYPTTFLERYNDAQFLPSQKYTANTILGTSLITIREHCDATAIALSRSPIMKEVPHVDLSDSTAFLPSLLFEERGMKNSWGILSEAIREAHEMG